MSYVDGFVLPVPKRNLRSYRSLARKAGKAWKSYGALEYRECVGDDLDVAMGPGFQRTARVKRGETVVFAWIVYKSRRHRDSVNAKVMRDKQLAKLMKRKAMPFDPTRVVSGGFKTIVAL